ncbi:MAG: TonB-dependent receptor [Bacteroidota bacterium]
MKKSILFLLVMVVSTTIFAQQLTQTVRGRLLDEDTQVPLFGAAVMIIGSDPPVGATTDAEGNFKISNVPVGRYNFKISYMGYETRIVKEINVSSGKETVLNKAMKETVTGLKEVTIKDKASKNEALNSMATISVRQLNVDEASRFAGGVDDPARLAATFAGVAGALGTNGIVVRGNAPKDLLWRMEGIEITNPNHFANLVGFGGGALTALSSNMLSNSDFFTGAFPAEYGNALSGVFDLKMRTGNSEKREHTFQAGGIGIDISSEGPFVKGKQATYLFNYRYATLALLTPFLPKEMGILKYQDLAFKINLPSKKAGTLSLWGIGAYDVQRHDAKDDTSEWKTDADSKEYEAKIYFGATGITHRLLLGKKTYINTTLAASGNGLGWTQNILDTLLVNHQDQDLKNNAWKYTASFFMNHKFNASLVNRTGVVVNRMEYDIRIRRASDYFETMQEMVNEKGSARLTQFYTQFRLELTRSLTLNAGVHSQQFSLNNEVTIEPRAGLSWDVNSLNTFSFAYGKHSRMEPLNFYLLKQSTADGIIQPNKKLELSKADHYVLGYSHRFSEYLFLRVEPYCQQLYDVPVVPGSYYSLQNLDIAWYFSDSLVNKGTGKNYGVDFTLERFLNKSYYYMITASVFESKYTGGDGIERDTRYNKNFVVNLLGGREWKVKEKNVFGLNLRYTLSGGDRFIPYDATATYAAQQLVLDYNHAFEQSKPILHLLCMTLKYDVNKPKYTGTWALSIVNALMYRDFQEFVFNSNDQTITRKTDLLFVPNVSYRIQF